MKNDVPHLFLVCDMYDAMFPALRSVSPLFIGAAHRAVSSRSTLQVQHHSRNRKIDDQARYIHKGGHKRCRRCCRVEL